MCVPYVMVKSLWLKAGLGFMGNVILIGIWAQVLKRGVWKAWVQGLTQSFEHLSNAG